jgi:hypothetical protein
MRYFQVFGHPPLVADFDGLVNIAINISHGGGEDDGYFGIGGGAVVVGGPGADGVAPGAITGGAPTVAIGRAGIGSFQAAIHIKFYAGNAAIAIGGAGGNIDAVANGVVAVIGRGGDAHCRRLVGRESRITDISASVLAPSSSVALAIIV